MSRSKKIRKGGENSSKLQARQKKTDRVLASKKRDTGNKSGTRHNEQKLQAASQGTESAKDPRHGSKKPVALVIEKSINKAATVKIKQPKLTDEQKLLKLEDDPRLNKLLDMLEEGREPSADDQLWLNKQLDEIERLLTKLGISEEDDAKQIMGSLSDDDLLNKFESGAELLNDYKN